MKAILAERPGNEDVLNLAEAESPFLTPDSIRIRVHAAGVNRADLLQREGHYPPPPGASPILGLECSGEVVEVGAEVSGWSRGDRVMALLAGGGYAEEVVVASGSVMRIPDSMSWAEAAGFPETFITAWLNIFLLAQARSGEKILVHGGGSGVGTSALTLCKLAGMHVIVTAGSDDKCRRCLELGADEAINYRSEDFVQRAAGSDVILDHVGAQYLPRDLQALARGGRVVVIGLLGGDRMATIDVGALLANRQTIIGSTLRARPVQEKAAIIAAFLAKFGEQLAQGRIRPVISDVYPWERVAEAHHRMKSSGHFGKIVLQIH